jgi:hypothetical protein
MKSIITKYLPATNHKGSRIKAKAFGVKPITLSYDYALDAEGNHLGAALRLCKANGWPNDLVSGALPDQTGYAFCFSK